jgi:cytochrome c-type biogenesis protein CcmH
LQRRLMFVLTLGLLLLPLAGALALEPYSFSEPSQENRYRALINELRCLVCQNQSLADSNAELAGDLRREVQQQISAGASDKEIIDFMVARYGDFVLYRPPLRLTTVLLWSGPFLLVAGLLLVLGMQIRRGSREAPVPLNEEERQRLAALLHREDG